VVKGKADKIQPADWHVPQAIHASASYIREKPIQYFITVIAKIMSMAQ
jgi:hypothetical protein